MNTMNPCFEYCYLHFGKQYSTDCDSVCDYAKAVQEVKRLKEELRHVTNHSVDNGQSYTAFAYEDDGVTVADLSTYDDKEEAIAFAKSRKWDEVVDDISGEVVWHK